MDSDQVISRIKKAQSLRNEALRAFERGDYDKAERLIKDSLELTSGLALQTPSRDPRIR